MQRNQCLKCTHPHWLVILLHTAINTHPRINPLIQVYTPDTCTELGKTVVSLTMTHMYIYVILSCGKLLIKPTGIFVLKQISCGYQSCIDFKYDTYTGNTDGLFVWSRQVHELWSGHCDWYCRHNSSIYMYNTLWSGCYNTCVDCM